MLRPDCNKCLYMLVIINHWVVKSWNRWTYKTIHLYNVRLRIFSSMVRKRGWREYLNGECGTAFKAYEYPAIIDLRSKLRTGENKISLHNMRDTRKIVFFLEIRGYYQHCCMFTSCKSLLKLLNTWLGLFLQRKSLIVMYFCSLLRGKICLRQ